MRSAWTLTQVPVLAVVLLSINPELLGQSSDTWQAVPRMHPALKDNPANPGSSAMILERQIYTDDVKHIQAEWVRIKVLTEKGRANANVEIPYLAKSISIEGIRGRTVRPDGGVIS